jgi:TolB-like protein
MKGPPPPITISEKSATALIYVHYLSTAIFKPATSRDFLTGGNTKVPNLFLIARESAFAYKGKQVKVKQVSEELGVQYV